MVRYYNHYHREDTNFWISQIVNSKDEGRFCHVVYPENARKAGGLQILCCQGINVTDYNFNLDALALKPSDFCTVGGLNLFRGKNKKILPDQPGLYFHARFRYQPVPATGKRSAFLCLISAPVFP